MAKNLASQYSEYNSKRKFEVNPKYCGVCGAELIGRNCSHCENKSLKLNVKHKKLD